MSKKIILNLEECANILGITIEELKDLIENEDVKTIGTKKNMISCRELEKFIGEISGNAIDNTSNQRYNPTTSIEVTDLSDEEYEEMKRKSNGEGSVYYNEQRNKWCGAVSLGYDDNGKRIRKVVTGDTKELVEMKIKEIKSDAVFEKISEIPTYSNRHPKADMLFNDFINEYLEMVKNKTTTTTFANKCENAKHIREGIGQYKISELNMMILEKFINDFTIKDYIANKNSLKGEKIKRKYSQSSIHKVYVLLHSIIKYAVATEIIDKDYMLYIDKPKSKAVKSEKNQALSDEKIKILKGMVDAQDNIRIKLLFYLSLALGGRPSEIFALRFSDFDYETRTVSIQRTLSSEKKVETETGKIIEEKPIISNIKNFNPERKYNVAIRKIRVSEFVINMIKQYEENIKDNKNEMNERKKNGTEDFLFVNHEYKLATTNYYIQQYKRMLIKNGYKYSEYTAYSLRHTFCTRLMKETDLKTVQKIMGDSNPEIILRHYANMGQEDMNKATEKVADAFKLVFSENV